MTTGQLVFYSGVGLLALTILLAVVFAVKKPRYDPEAAGLGPGTGSTRKLRSGYPTDPLTIRRASPAGAGVETERLPEDSAQPGTVRLTGDAADGTAVLPEEETAPRPEDTSPRGTVPLVQEQETDHPEAGTIVLSESEGPFPSGWRERGD